MLRGLQAAALGLMLAVGVSVGFPGKAAAAHFEVDIGFFFDHLAPYGHWFKHPRHGHAWYPIGVEPGWRPYTHGRWIYTTDYGWYWDSDYAWGWAPFHYGRWDFDDDFGWIWIPGFVWGPAWVFWSIVDDFIGWAPIPPIVIWIEGRGLRYHGFDPGHRRFDHAWMFVDRRHFNSPRLRDFILPRAKSFTIGPRARDITAYDARDGRVVNRGVAVEEIERATGARIPRLSAREVGRAPLVEMEREDQKRLPVFRPRLRPAPELEPPAPEDLKRRRAAEEAIVEEWHRAETEQLIRRQRIERETVGKGKNRDELMRRQNRERTELQQRQRIERRQQFDRIWPRQPGPSGD